MIGKNVVVVKHHHVGQFAVAALDGAAAAYEKSTGNKVVISYAGSSALAKQIEQGAPADIFVSADLDWMDYVQKAKLIKDDTRFNLFGNRLVLIAPKASTVELKIGKDFPLAVALGDNHLAMANVKSVPAGKYGSAALEKLGEWSAVEPKVAQADNVRGRWLSLPKASPAWHRL